MSRRRYYHSRDGRELTEEEATDENGIIHDGVRMVTPLYLTDARGRTLTDAFGQPLPAIGGRSGYTFVDDADNAQRRREDYDFYKAELSNRWKSGLEQGDRFQLGDKRVEVLGFDDNDKMHVAGIDVDLRQEAYQEYKQYYPTLGKRRRSPTTRTTTRRRRGSESAKTASSSLQGH